jgi:hypothetical protein
VKLFGTVTVAANYGTGAGTVLMASGNMSTSLTSDTVTLNVNNPLRMLVYSAATGNRVGTITIQGSDNGSDWRNLTFDRIGTTATNSVTVSASTEVSFIADFQNQTCRYIRVKFNKTGGTAGTLTLTEYDSSALLSNAHGIKAVSRTTEGTMNLWLNDLYPALIGISVMSSDKLTVPYFISEAASTTGKIALGFVTTSDLSTVLDPDGATVYVELTMRQ